VQWRQIAYMSLLTERKNSTVRSTINVPLLRSEETPRSQHFARKLDVAYLLRWSSPLSIEKYSLQKKKGILQRKEPF